MVNCERSGSGEGSLTGDNTLSRERAQQDVGSEAREAEGRRASDGGGTAQSGSCLWQARFQTGYQDACAEAEALVGIKLHEIA